MTHLYKYSMFQMRQTHFMKFKFLCFIRDLASGKNGVFLMCILQT